ncbi:MAG: hypothetical protein HY863_15800 [Chloroflexi bacterium]|nr:hypothetical protein [Chloroflexota bacterium]
MPIYGEFKYGKQKYGATVLDSPRFALEIDWDNNGLFDGSNEARYLHALTVTRGRPYYIKKDGTGFERLNVGKLTGIFNNEDGRFNVENISSPYYPYIPIGKEMRLRVRTPSDQRLAVFAGIVDDLVPDSQLAGKASISADDGVRLLKQESSVAVQTNIRTDEAIPLMLEKIGWPSRWGSDLDIGADVRNYWWLDRGSVLEAIHDLADSELGAVWMGADGKLKFRSRYTSVPVVASLTEADFLLGTIETPRPWEMVRNALRVNVYPTVLETAVEVWKWQEIPFIAAGASRTVFASFTYNGGNVPVESLVAPVATTDYTANSASDGSGTNLTANFSVTVLDQFSGTAKLSIANNGGTGGYPTLTRLRANAITVPNQTFVEAQDNNSILRYQRRTFEMAIRWFQSSAVAQGLTDFMVSFLSTPRLFVKAIIRGNPDLQFGIDLGEAVDLYLPDKGIDGVYRLAWLQHKNIDRGLRVFDTTMLFEPFPDLSGSYWQFPAEVGVTTIFAP